MKHKARFVFEDLAAERAHPLSTHKIRCCQVRVQPATTSNQVLLASTNTHNDDEQSCFPFNDKRTVHSFSLALVLMHKTAIARMSVQRLRADLCRLVGHMSTSTTGRFLSLGMRLFLWRASRFTTLAPTPWTDSGFANRFTTDVWLVWGTGRWCTGSGPGRFVDHVGMTRCFVVA